MAQAAASPARKLAVEEKPEGEHHEQGARRGHHVGRYAARRQPAGGMEGRHRPQMLGDDVGGALIGAHEHAPFDGGAIGGGDGYGIGRFALAQGLPEMCVELGGSTLKKLELRGYFACSHEDFGDGVNLRALDLSRDGHRTGGAFADQQQVQTFQQDRDQRLIEHRIGANDDDRAIVVGRVGKGDLLVQSLARKLQCKAFVRAAAP